MNKKRKLGKRIATLLLCMVMVLSIVNLPGFAITAYALNYTGAGTEWSPYVVHEYDHVRNLMATDGDVWIKLGRDIEATDIINKNNITLGSGKKVLDLAGYKLSRSCESIDYSMITVGNGATLEIRNSNTSKQGVISFEKTGDLGRLISCEYGGELVLGSPDNDSILLTSNYINHAMDTNELVYISGDLVSYNGVEYSGMGTSLRADKTSGGSTANVVIYGGHFMNALQLEDAKAVTIYEATVEGRAETFVGTLSVPTADSIYSESKIYQNGSAVTLQDGRYLLQNGVVEIIYGGLPIILTNPDDQSCIANGSYLAFSVDALYATDYEWQFLLPYDDGERYFYELGWDNVRASCDKIEGIDSKNLRIVPIPGETSLNNKATWCVVSNAAGSVYTDAAYMSVEAPGDFIGTVGITVEKPVIGNKVNNRATITNNISAATSFTGGWCYLTEDGDYYELEENQVFEAGKFYTYRIGIIPNDSMIMFSKAASVFVNDILWGDFEIGAETSTGKENRILYINWWKTVAQPATDEEKFQYSENTDGTVSIDGYKGTDTNVTIPSEIEGKAVTKIRDTAFESSTIEVITISEGVKEIGWGTFANCESLTTVYLPSTLTYIDDLAFSDSDAITDVYYNGSEAEWKAINIGSDNESLTGANIHFKHEHTGGTATCTKKAVCEICGEEYGEVNPGNHDFSKCVSNGDGTHKVMCKDCDTVQEGHDKDACSGGKATCTKKAKCTKCGKEYGKLAEHTLKTTTTTKATLTADGKKETKCTVCGKVTKTTKIYAAKTIKLSKTTYTYDGKAKKPTVTIKDSKGKAIATTNYSVKYDDGRKNVGKYNVKITFKGDYKGSKTLSFTINPKATTLKSVTPASKAFTAKWTKQTTQVDGYELEYALDKNFTSSAKKVTVSKNTTTSKKISSLKAKKTYYVRVRTYKKVGTKKYYSDWSKILNVKTK